jgi:hypothetical protein
MFIEASPANGVRRQCARPIAFGLDFKEKEFFVLVRPRPRGQTLGGDSCLSTGDTREALPARHEENCEISGFLRASRFDGKGE